ncbi:MAG: exosortase/archaeosortase family protein [Dehalococcoidia bacterium]|nr:exosortase/archaeosortase family protein [Dehalococcoidia bacterium]
MKQKRHLPLWPALLLVFAILTLLYLPTFIWLVQSWLHNAPYSHGFLIPLVSGLIVWTKRKELKQTQPNDAGAIGLALGGALYIVGFVWDMRYLSAISFIVVLFGLVLSFYGTRVARSVTFAIGFLIFMIPMPFIDDITFNLQSISIHSSSWLLRVMGMPITTTGNLISLDDTTFSIGLPCSGLNTLIALLAFAALYVYLLAGPYSKRVVLFLCSIPIAILANILRIASIVLVAHYYDMDFAAGFYHDISNLPVFLLAILLIALIGKLMGLRFMART